MKWPSIDESVSLCICLLTVACNCKIQPFFIGYSLWGEKYFGFGLNLTVLLGPGSGFNFKPMQTSRRAVSDPLPEPLALLQQNTLLPI